MYFSCRGLTGNSFSYFKILRRINYFFHWALFREVCSFYPRRRYQIVVSKEAVVYIRFTEFTGIFAPAVLFWAACIIISSAQDLILGVMRDKHTSDLQVSLISRIYDF